MIKKETRKKLRIRRHLRLRQNVKGTAERPRLCVSRTGKHIYVQVIDDEKSHTLIAASSLEPTLKSDLKTGGNIDAAIKVGQAISQKAKEKNITKVVFDRGGNLYHGRVAALAKSAREGGLEF